MYTSESSDQRVVYGRLFIGTYSYMYNVGYIICDSRFSTFVNLVSPIRGLSFSRIGIIEVIVYMENTNRYKSEDKRVNKAHKLINKLALSLSAFHSHIESQYNHRDLIFVY